jgi:hypothetical protein
MKCWVQEWEESERGWGVRPDGFTAHRKKEDIAVFLKQMRDNETKGKAAGYVPSEYSRPSGDPFECEVAAALAPKVSSIGIYLPHDWKRPK